MTIIRDVNLSKLIPMLRVDLEKIDNQVRIIVRYDADIQYLDRTFNDLVEKRSQ